MLDVISFVAVLLLLGGLAFRPTRDANMFAVAGRSVRLFPLVATLVMTELNTSTLLAFSAVGYRVGARAILLSGVFLVGLAWYAVSVSRRWKEYNGTSVAGWFSARYGANFGRFVAVLLLLAMWGFSATYLKSLTMILSHATGLDGCDWCWIVAIAGSGLLLSLSGGLASIVRLDVWSFVLTCLLLPGLLAIGYSRSLTPGRGFGDIAGSDARWIVAAGWSDPQLPLWFVLSLALLTCLTYICSPWYGQKVFAAVDERTACLAMALTAIIVFALYAAAQAASALYFLEQPDLKDAQFAVPGLIVAWLPPGIRGAAFATLSLISLTSLAGVWSAMTSMIAASFENRSLEDVRQQRRLMSGIAVLTALGAIWLVDDILSRLILANIPIAALSFALLGGFYWSGASRIGAYCSVVAGIGWGTGCYLWYGDAGGYTWYWAVGTVPVVFVAGWMGSTHKPDERSVDGGENASRLDARRMAGFEIANSPLSTTTEVG